MYVEQDWSLTADQLAAMRAISAKVDLAPGPGGSRITPCGDVDLGIVNGKGAVVALYPSSQLVAHCDPPIEATRYHVPLVVNAGCWVFHRGHWQQLVVGHVYQMDPTHVHGAVNWGTERRTHLIVDVKE